MARVLDVASYILQKQGTMTSLTLQKLVYYTQVWWSLEHDEPLFPEPIKAWAQGPVVPALFHEHKGRRRIDARDVDGDANALTVAEQAKIGKVLAFYGELPPHYLSDLTHFERPWKESRDRGERRGYDSPTISIGAIRAFYRGRTPEDLNADYQMSLAERIMDEHPECLARLAL